MAGGLWSMERHDKFSLPFAFARRVKHPFRFAIRNFTRSVSPLAILLLWCFFFFGYGISVCTLYRTEALRAIIGREALHGSWLMPTLYGEPFLSKPPGLYVAIAAA